MDFWPQTLLDTFCSMPDYGFKLLYSFDNPALAQNCTEMWHTDQNLLYTVALIELFNVDMCEPSPMFEVIPFTILLFHKHNFDTGSFLEYQNSLSIYTIQLGMFYIKI